MRGNLIQLSSRLGLLLQLIAIIMVCCSSLGAQAIYSVEGKQTDEAFGTSIAVADVDDDGVLDVIATGPYYSSTGKLYNGRVGMYSGVDGSEIDETFGDYDGNRMGLSVSIVGDLDSDGTPDFVIGAHNNDIDHTDPAYARVFSGADLSTIYTKSFDPGYWMGYSVAGVGDVDGDGVEDFLAGRPHYNTGSNILGRAYVYSGDDGSLIHTFTGGPASDALGYRVAAAGDVNSDGYADLLVASHVSVEPVRVFSGYDGSYLYTACAVDDTVTPNQCLSSYHPGLTALGDIDSDGYDDFVVANSSSVVRAISGYDGSEIYKVEKDYTQAYAYGYALSPGGDIDGDGVTDLLVGAPGYTSSNVGFVEALSGVDGSLIYTLEASTSNTQFGFSVANVGDIDGDGVLDVAVGENHFDTSSNTDAGRVVIMAGAIPSDGECNLMDYLFLQNETETGTVSYEREGVISAGYNVDPGSTAGNYVVSGSSADVELKSGTQVYFASGFQVKDGATLHAGIDPTICD